MFWELAPHEFISFEQTRQMEGSWPNLADTGRDDDEYASVPSLVPNVPLVTPSSSLDTMLCPASPLAAACFVAPAGLQCCLPPA